MSTLNQQELRNAPKTKTDGSFFDIFLLVVTLISFMFFLQNVKAAGPEVVQNAKAAELALHKVERLVILKKIHPSFLTHLETLSIQITDQAALGDAPKFTVLLAEPETDSVTHAKSSMLLVLAANGRVLSFQEQFLGFNENWATFPDKDAVTLAENSLHFVLDGTLDHPELTPYLNSLTELKLANVGNGEVKATLQTQETQATPQSASLNIWLNFEGIFLRFQNVLNEK